MNSNDDTALIIAVLALMVSLAALAVQLVSHWRQHRQAALATNLASLAEVQLQIVSNPHLLRFHSVTDQDLSEHGVSAAELAYLVANFHTGSIYYSTVDVIPNESIFTEDDPYRYYMMKSPDTRKAWPLIKRFMNNSTYKTRLQVTAAAFDKAITEQGLNKRVAENLTEVEKNVAGLESPRRTRPPESPDPVPRAAAFPDRSKTS